VTKIYQIIYNSQDFIHFTIMYFRLNFNLKSKSTHNLLKSDS